MRALLASVVLVSSIATVAAQRGGPPAPQVPRAAAPIDLTGYWVPLITEDWRYRIVTPPPGDYTSVPMNPAARKLAASWDPARDEAAGEQCRGYGVGGVMRLPGRLRISWQDDRTLKIETEAGSQVRTLAFAANTAAPTAAPNTAATTTDAGWQGVSRASWDRPEGPMGSGAIFGGGGFGAGRASGGSLKVVTTGMKPGYLRKNGVPYSANAVITEYFDRFDLDGGDVLMVVATETVDPTYLSQPYWTSTHFKRQANATGWSPTACSAR
jgi:hypothetical protein